MTPKLTAWQSTQAIVAAIAFLSTAVHAGDVLVVNAAGGGAFTQIQPAINAAVDGDAILIKSGSYAGFQIVGKALSVVADAGAEVELAGTITVKNLSASQSVNLVRLQATALVNSIGYPSFDLGVATGLTLSNNLGAVRAYSCTFAGGAGVDAPPLSFVSAGHGGDGVYVSNCSDVAFARSVFAGGAGGDSLATADKTYAGNGGRGLVVMNSSVALFESSLVGDDAGSTSVIPASAGAHGGHGAMTIGSGYLFAGNTVFAGGDGGNAGGNHFEQIPGGNGGHGLALLASSSVAAKLRGNTYSGGVGGPGSTPFGDDGALGQGLSALGGTVTEYPGSSVQLTARTPAREGGSILIAVQGEPGAQVSLVASGMTAFVDAPTFFGIKLVSVPWSPTRMRKLGPIPPSGVLAAHWPVSQLPPGTDVGSLHLQVYSTNAGVATIGGFVPVVVLDSAF